jgi:hypothetical protein
MKLGGWRKIACTEMELEHFSKRKTSNVFCLRAYLRIITRKTNIASRVAYLVSALCGAENSRLESFFKGICSIHERSKFNTLIQNPGYQVTGFIVVKNRSILLLLSC